MSEKRCLDEDHTGNTDRAKDDHRLSSPARKDRRLVDSDSDHTSEDDSQSIRTSGVVVLTQPVGPAHQSHSLYTCVTPLEDEEAAVSLECGPFLFSRVQHLGFDEMLFLFYEIMVADVYSGHGFLTIPRHHGAVVFDVGANIGLFSLHCHARNPLVRLFAFEPIATTFAVLEANLRHTHGTLKRGACGHGSQTKAELFVPPNSTGEATAHLEESEQMQRITEQHGGPAVCDRSNWVKEVCPVTTVSAVMKSDAVPEIDLLKIDVEGDEYNVLCGITDQDWPSIRQVAVEVHDVEDRLVNCERILNRHGFATKHVKQQSCIVNNEYQMTIPEELNLYYLYAKRS